MSYTTNSKALRLGISHKWNYSAHGPISNFHLENKITIFINSLVDYVVPQAPANAKTKNTQIRGFGIQPGMQGKTKIIRSANQIFISSYFYLSYDGATEEQIKKFNQSIQNVAELIHKETTYTIQFKSFNYFIFYWRFELFNGINCSKKLYNKIIKCIFRNPKLEKEHIRHKKLKLKIDYVNRYLKRFKKNKFYNRTFYPILSAFNFQEFDSHIAAKTIALELQILRKQHKKFLYFIKKFINICFKKWNETKLIQGIKIVITGRTTNYRRQIRRTQKKILTFGIFKKNFLKIHAGHSIQISYNRYGVISVQLYYQMASQFSEKFYDKNIPELLTNYFSIKKFQEKINFYTNINKDYFNFNNINIKNNSKNFNFIYNKNKYSKKFQLYKNYQIHKKNNFFNSEFNYYAKNKKIKIFESDFISFYENNNFKNWLLKKKQKIKISKKKITVFKKILSNLI